MASVATHTTANELLQLTDGQHRYELIRGELKVMSPAGNLHGQVAAQVCARVATFVSDHHLGVTFGAETGFLIAQDPDTVRAPDFAFVTVANAQQTGSTQGYWPGVPDLLAEVVSPNDTFSEVQEKVHCWLEAGAQAVWVVDPIQKQVTVYRSRTDVTVIEETATLEAPDLLPGWSVEVAKLFPHI